MAIVRFDGERVRADPIRKQGTGWLMKSLQHASRLTQGTEFFVLDDDVVTMIQPGELESALNSGFDLEAAMAAERETLPTPSQVIRDNPPIAHDAPGKVETK